MNVKIITFIISILIAGGAIGGYKLVKDNQANVFENSHHPVLEVLDGDTIRIPYYKTEDNIRVRLLGIDAPESGECFHDESKEYLEKLLKDQDIVMRKDISGTDSYGRLLRNIFLPSTEPEADDVFINHKMVKDGYAMTEAVAPDKMYRDLLSSAQVEAIREKKGMWWYCEYDPNIRAVMQGGMHPSEEPPSPDCTIKGNISERGFGKVYFVEGCTSYTQTKIDTQRGEQYFCTEEEAEEAGFRKSELCPD